jgi:hypothetical protein
VVAGVLRYDCFQAAVIIKAFPAPEEYAEAENEFLRTLGLCVTQWAFVDRQLFRLFRFGLQTATHRAAVVYYKSRTLQQRIQFVDELLKQSLSLKQYEEHWCPFAKRLEDLVPVRNIIVHQPTRRLHTAKRGKAVYEYAIHIEPYERMLNKNPKGLKGKSAIEIDDLKSHAEAVHDLERDLKSLVRRLVGAGGS